MKIVDSVEDAVRQIAEFEGSVFDFRLALSERLLDPIGVNMAIITDHILKRGWLPDGFSQGDGFRTYHYKSQA